MIIVVASALFLLKSSFSEMAHSQGTVPGIIAMLDSISIDGITWTFSQAVPAGRFVNGDYYVIGPVTVVNITPLPSAEGGRDGSVLNMPVDNSELSPFDSRVAANRYAPQLRIYPPFTMHPGDALISSISVNQIGDYPSWLREGEETPESPVRTVSVLTCLPAAVSADAFRPSYADRSQKIYYADSLRRTLLPLLPKVMHTPDISVFTWHFRRPWLDICFFGFDAAVEYQANYGREVGRSVGIASLLLTVDLPEAAKDSLLINLVQYGIDLWGIARAGYYGWPAFGGHGTGRKWPITLAGIMLGDQDMQELTRSSPALRFGEDMQTMLDKGWTGADVVYAGHQGVWNGVAVSSTPSWGPYENLPPSLWQSTFSGDPDYHIGEDYRRCCTSIAWIGEALAARILHAENLWNHDPFFAYADRWMTENDAAAIATIKAATGLDYSADWERQGQAWDPFVDEMWSAYRNNLPQKTTAPGAAEPVQFRLLQNYPNPFNPETTIAYEVPSESHVIITLFDVLGRNVRTLVDRHDAPGNRSVNVDASGLASGIYFYQMRAGSFVATKTLVLLR
ncbi:MAG TPA: T9SS type A sorting domain-containing protein [Bacteroidota bacterium]|nr:T9SS type A sorting domain-containing protein [Bacteroidota bacterium]